MSDNDEEVQEARIRILRNPNLVTVYSNNVNLTMNSMEIRVTFLDTHTTADEQGPIATERIAVVMTPEFGKVFSEQLSGALASFERNFGSIRNPRVGPDRTKSEKSQAATEKQA